MRRRTILLLLRRQTEGVIYEIHPPSAILFSRRELILRAAPVDNVVVRLIPIDVEAVFHLRWSNEQRNIPPGPLCQVPFKLKVTVSPCRAVWMEGRNEVYSPWEGRTKGWWGRERDGGRN